MELRKLKTISSYGYIPKPFIRIDVADTEETATYEISPPAQDSIELIEPTTTSSDRVPQDPLPSQLDTDTPKTEPQARTLTNETLEPNYADDFAKVLSLYGQFDMLKKDFKIDFMIPYVLLMFVNFFF